MIVTGRKDLLWQCCAFRSFGQCAALMDQALTEEVGVCVRMLCNSPHALVLEHPWYHAADVVRMAECSLGPDSRFRCFLC